MSLTDAQQTMDAYVHDLLNHGDYARHFSDEVVIEVLGTEQRYSVKSAETRIQPGRLKNKRIDRSCA